ncbi:MAG: zf-HC2 domain-containing protein [Candidatus Coatesbacteria bacterium]|nr:zf-HC2 domain-containing protein [Candidatus Coatesbacteria bacterium]
MNCKRFMELIDEYFLGLPQESLKSEFEDHLRICANCRSEFERAKILHAALRSQPAPVSDLQWSQIESRALKRLRSEFAKKEERGFISRLLELFSPIVRPQPRLVLALASTLIIVFVAMMSLFWFESAQERLISDDLPFQSFWTEDGSVAPKPDSQIASLIEGVDKILSSQNTESSYETDTVLDAISEVSGIDALDPDDIENQLDGYYNTWAVNGGYYSDVLDASNDEIVSAIKAVFNESESGS